MATKLRSITENPSWSKKQRRIFDSLEAGLPIIMDYATSEIPVLDNHSDKQIVDEVGVLKAVKKAVEAAEKPHAERLKARMGDRKVLDGTDYAAEIRSSTRTAISQGVVKEFIEKCDALEIDIMKVLNGIANKEITLPNNVFLNVPSEAELAAGAVEDGDGSYEDTNGKYFYASTSVGALYVKEQ